MECGPHTQSEITNISSFQVWQLVLKAINVTRASASLDDLIQWVAKCCRKTSNKGVLIPMVFAETIYGIWLVRNAKKFRTEYKNPLSLYREILFRVICRCPQGIRADVNLVAC